MKKYKCLYSLLQSIFAIFFWMYCIESWADDVNNSNGSWYERTFDQLLKTKIVTSTREEQDIELSANAISVFTADDIKRMGIRNIKELLERTPGFFITQQLAGPALGSRGFMGDNEQFLLLIDGHNMNSIVDKGAGSFFLYPFLEHVERVEILRGPGSTLWGSDAALGIIHIITKDGKGIEGLKITQSIASEDHYQYTNLQGGETLGENINYMASLTLGQSDGFPDRSPLPKDSAWDSFSDSYELYIKAQLRNTKIYARSSDTKSLRPGGSMAEANYIISNAADAFTRSKHDYVDIQHDKKISDKLDLEIRFFSSSLEGWQSQINPTVSGITPIVEESASNRENSLGLETLAHWDANQFHRLLIGMRLVQTEIDPVSNIIIFPSTATPSSATPVINMRVVPDGLDRNLAFFAEDNWKIATSVNLIYGFRIDKNSLREDNTIILPRLSINWKMHPEWSGQYSYTTGYIRPPVGIGFLGQAQYNTFGIPSKIYGAQESEEVASHDIRLMWNHEPVSVKWDMFYNIIDNSFNFDYENAVVSGEDRTLLFINTNKIHSYGNELEFNYVPSKVWNLYGNLSYILSAKLSDPTGFSYGLPYDLNHTAFGFGEGAFGKDGTIIAYPHKIWNLGVNVFFNDKISGNINYRGWSDITMRERFNLNKEDGWGPEHFIDMNLRYVNIADTNLDLSFFVKNLLNNANSDTPMIYYSQTWDDRRMSVGMSASYTF